MKSGKLLVLIGIVLLNAIYLIGSPTSVLNSKGIIFENITSNSFTDVVPPTTPTNLAASNIKESSFDLYWNASTDDVGVAGYKIYQNDVLVKTVSGTVTSANIGGLLKATTYTYIVKAFDFSDNLSLSSFPLNITTLGTNDTEPPSSVKNLTAVKVTAKEIIIEWGASTDNKAVEKYQVYVNSSLYSSTFSTSMLINGLLPGTSYNVAVIAMDNSGNLSSSREINVNTLVYTDIQAPSTPNLSYSITGAEITLQWNNIYDYVGVSSIQIFQNGVLIKTIAGDLSSYVVSGLNKNTSYNFYIKAVDYSNNVSNASNTVNITTPGDADTQNPTPPTNLTANVVKNNITIQWTASTDNVAIDYYYLAISNTSIGAWTFYTTKNTSYFFSNLSAGSKFLIYVAAYDISGNFSDWYTNIYATTEGTVDKTPPTMPTNLVVNSVTKTEIVFGWDASTDNIGIDKYRVFKNDAFYADIKSTSATVSGLTPGTSYNFNVQAFDFNGNSSSKSYYLTATTKSDVDISEPSAPTNLHASVVGQTDVLLEWNKSTDNIGVHHYNVYQYGFYVDSTTGSGIVVNKLNQNSNYKFYITAVDDAGNESVESNEISVWTKATALFKFPAYCTSLGESQIDEWIDYFGLESIDNPSGRKSGGYSNFVYSFNPVYLNPNTSYTLYGRIGYSGTFWDEYLSFWIDYNRDGDFDDVGEQVQQGGPLATTALLSGSFTTPSDFDEGPTVLRVSMKYDDYPEPCETFTYGEVEDYPVYLSKNKSSVIGLQLNLSNAHNINIPIPSKLAIFPNPAKDEIAVSSLRSDVEISIYSLMGMHLKTVKLNGDIRKIDISDLKAGSYLIKMNMGGKVISKQFIKE